MITHRFDTETRYLRFCSDIFSICESKGRKPTELFGWRLLVSSSLLLHL